MQKTFKKIEKSRVVISELMLPSHSNFSGKIHGGYILSLMDQIAFACASKHSGEYCVTASVNTVNFLKPIEIGELVTMKASINYVGNTSMVVGIRVESENIRTGAIKHCNSSFFTMVAKDDTGKSVPVPGIVLENATQVRRFVKSIYRNQMTREGDKALNEKDFSASEYLEELKNYKVIIDESLS